MADQVHDNSDEMWLRYHSKKAGSVVHALHKLKTSVVCKIFAKRILGFTSGSPARILELGCGTGSTLSELQKMTGAHCLGIDRNQFCLERAREMYNNVEFRQGDLFNLDLEAKSFDLVYSVGLLEHFSQEDQEKILERHLDLTKDAVALMTPADSLLMNAILFANRRILGRTGTWADEEVFSAGSLKRKFGSLRFKSYKDAMFGNLILWFGGQVDQVRLPPSS